MKKTPKILPTYYKSQGTPIFRDTTALPFALGGTIHFEPSEYGSDPREHYVDGGPIYTYAKRSGSYYQKTPQGQWLISNSSTNNQYVPINDPTGERSVILNKGAVIYNPVQGVPQVTPTPIKTQQVAAKKNSPLLEDQAQYKQIAKEQAEYDFNQAQQDMYQQALAKTRLQAAEPANWVFAAPMAAPAALEAMTALASVPIGAGATVGDVLGTAGTVHGISQIDNRVDDWKQVSAGKMDWKEAALKTGLTGLDAMGAVIPIKNASRAIKAMNAPPLKVKGQTIIGDTAAKKVVGTIDEYGNIVDNSGVTTYGASSPIKGKPTKLGKNIGIGNLQFNSEPPAITLQEWEQAKKLAEAGNERFIIPKSEEKFLVNKYADEFAEKFNIPIDELNPKDVGLYGKLKESNFLPTRQPVKVSDAKFMPPLSKEIHSTFLQTHKPELVLTKPEELVLDAYARGYDDLINRRGNSFASPEFYENDIAPILEQTILKNKFQEPQTLIRGTKDFEINNGASVIRDGKVIENLKFSDLQEGDLFVPKSFTSTSVTKANPNTDLGFEAPLTGFTERAGNLDYVINAPAGQSYMYPNASNILHFPQEMEVILPKDLQFKLDRVASETERGFLNSADDIQKGVLYKGFTKMPNKYFPSISMFDKIVDLKGNKIPKKNVPNLIDYHNKMHQPSVPKYYFSIANPYLFGGMLNKKY